MVRGTPRYFPHTHPSTTRVIYLEDNDLVHLRGGAYTVYNFGSGESPEEVRRTVQTLTMEVSQIMKVG